MNAMPWCPVCEKDAVAQRTLRCPDLSGSANDYEIVFCNCGLGITLDADFPNGNSDANARMYDDVQQRIMMYYHRLFNHFKARYNESLHIFKKYCSGDKLLEVGSNIGFTADLAAKAGYTVRACEINDRCRSLSETLHPHLSHHKDLFSLHEKFDVVTMCDVLEHFPQPWKALDQVKTLLTDKGILFIQLPNHDSSSADRQGRNWSFYDLPDHTFHFTPVTLKRLLANRGFNAVWIRTVDIPEDSLLVRTIPSRFRQKILEMIYQNPFYQPGFYVNRGNRGSMIQCISTPVSGRQA
jgi:SAM-dependent methyltransferase